MQHEHSATETEAAPQSRKGCLSASAGVIRLAGSSSNVLESRSMKCCVKRSSSSDICFKALGGRSRERRSKVGLVVSSATLRIISCIAQTEKGSMLDGAKLAAFVRCFNPTHDSRAPVALMTQECVGLVKVHRREATFPDLSGGKLALELLN